MNVMRQLSSDDVDDEETIDFQDWDGHFVSDGAPGSDVSAVRVATKGEALVDNEEKMQAVDRDHITRADRIRSRRGAFRWLPVYCSNDVVHGSWWFVWGSALAMCTSIIPLVQSFYPIFKGGHSALPILTFYGTWTLLILSCFCYTIGSYAFTRAFADPVKPPIFQWRHVATDELLGAWLFLLGTMPLVPYSMMYWALNPSNVIYMGMVFASAVFVGACYMFVLACYPSDRKHKQCLKPTLRLVFGKSHWILKHLQNDWLAGTWFFFVANLVCLLGSFAIFWKSLHDGNQLEQFVYGLR
jgi:hypothetical protein